MTEEAKAKHTPPWTIVDTEPEQPPAYKPHVVIVNGMAKDGTYIYADLKAAKEAALKMAEAAAGNKDTNYHWYFVFAGEGAAKCVGWVNRSFASGKPQWTPASVKTAQVDTSKRRPVPVIYEIDDDGEATRAVFFCGNDCIDRFKIDDAEQFRMSVPNATSADYIDGEQCHTCGKDIAHHTREANQ